MRDVAAGLFGYCFAMTTPWGTPLATYASKSDFYTARPALGEGWKWAEHPGDAPLGADVHFGDDFTITVCAPEADTHQDLAAITGVVTAYERATGEIHVLAENMTHAAATRRFTP